MSRVKHIFNASTHYITAFYSRVVSLCFLEDQINGLLLSREENLEDLLAALYHCLRFTAYTNFVHKPWDVRKSEKELNQD